MTCPAPLQEIQSKGANPNIEWFDEVYQKNNHTNIFNIFLNTDISQTSLPLNFIKDISINHMPDFQIKERAILQINEVTDISQPVNIRKKLEVSTKNTLKLLLTDGKSIIIGITKSPINTQINPASDPGSKILLKPPITVKYGVALLTNDNIQYYGGKSPELMKKRSEIFKKVSNNQTFLGKKEDIDVSNIIYLPEINSKTISVSSPSSPSPSSSPSSSCSSTCPNKSICSKKQKENSSHLIISKKSPPKLSKSANMQFLSSDDYDFESDDSQD